LADPSESNAAGLVAPWRDEGSARDTLSALAEFGAARGGPDPARAPARAFDRTRLAAWLIRNDLGGLGFAWAAANDPELAAMLRGAAVRAAAGNLSHFAILDRIERRFESERLPMVLLKGAAVAHSGYHDASYRSMTDLDIWVRDEGMPRAVSALESLGLRQEPSPERRPDALQQRSGGERIFRPSSGEHGIVELHYGAFQGLWIKRTARPDSEAVWRRATRIAPGRHAHRLASEDAVLQTGFHVVVNQFGQSPLRGMMDLAVLARAHRIDWDAVAERARAWRLATATWLVLDRANRVIGLPGCGAALARLRPGRARRGALRALATPMALLSGRELTHTSTRHVFMLSLVDRPRDGARLVGRTLWPEAWWIAARYGRPVGHIEHLWGLVRRGTV
jgi:hypothetical protein